MLRDIARILEAMESLQRAFVWNDTPPGLEYWCDVYDKLYTLYIDAVQMEIEKRLAVVNG